MLSAVTVIGIGVGIVATLIGASWHLGSRISRVEARLESLITEGTCNSKRENMGRFCRQLICDHERIYHESSGVRRPSWPGSDPDTTC
jgi:hypothetical protein